MSDAWKSCYSCRDYALRRRAVLAEPLADKAQKEKRDVSDVVDEFMSGAHDRHLGGDPLYPGGPTRTTDPAIGRMVALLSPGLFSDSTRES